MDSVWKTVRASETCPSTTFIEITFFIVEVFESRFTHNDCTVFLKEVDTASINLILSIQLVYGMEATKAARSIEVSGYCEDIGMIYIMVT